MAIIKLAPWVKDVSGSLGGVVFKRYGDKHILSKKPDFTDYKPTQRQIDQRETFRKGSEYCKMALQSPSLRKPYQEKADRTRVPVSSVAMRDFLVKPVIHELNLKEYSGKAAEKIFVNATDDFEVISVHVQITGPSGNILEEGIATQTALDASIWQYTTKARWRKSPLSITATAVDRPGNKTTKTETK